MVGYYTILLAIKCFRGRHVVKDENKGYYIFMSYVSFFNWSGGCFGSANF
jgi:hypothetical protein